MRKTIAFILFIFSILTCLISCGKNPDAEKMLTEFISIYSVEGVVYTPEREEGDDGYITDELFRKIYVFEGDMPEKFAILLNSHPDSFAECGVFICSGSLERERVVEMCTERVRLLGRGSDVAFISISGAVVFYSTMPDKARAEAIWNKIVRSHT